MTATLVRRSDTRVYGKTTDAEESGGRGLLLALFFLSLLLPIQPDLGGQRMDPYRLMMLVLFVPFLRKLIAGKAGAFNAADGFMLCHVVWIVFTMVLHHGGQRFAYSMVWAIMLYGGYMTGRILIRSAADYRRFISYYLTALLVLSPFVIYELLTGSMIIAETMGKVFPAIAKYPAFRYGLSRVQAVFPHAILYGLFCSVSFASVFMLYRKRIFALIQRLVLVVGMTYMALSSAPLLSLGMQIGLITWGAVTRGRWRLLCGIFIAIFIFLELASNRGPVIILIETMTLDPSTAWWRVYIWEYGTQSVMNYPFFGIGLNDWVRPSWLASTVDNFWLVIAMQTGLPGLIFLVLALSVHIKRIVRAKGLSADQSAVRSGYMIALVGMFFTLGTVHAWDAMAVFVMFYIGAGAFLYTSPPEGDPIPDEAPDPRRGARLARQPVVAAVQPVAVPAATPPDTPTGPRARVQYTRFARTRPDGGTGRPHQKDS